MLLYLACRIANYAVLLFIATPLTYLLASASLNPPALWNHQGSSLSWDAAHANLAKYGTSHNPPVWNRCATQLHNVLFRWDWECTPKGELIDTPIGTKIFVSTRLIFPSVAIDMVGGVALEIWTTTRQYHFSNRAVSSISMIVISTPAIVIATLLQVLAIQIDRSSGLQIFEFTDEGEGALGRPQHLLFPTLSMSLDGITSYSRFQRNLMLDTPSADYACTARAKDLIRRKVLTRHALHTTLIPMATYFAFVLTTLFAGAAVTERICGWHDMDEYSTSAVSGMDINGVTAAVTFFGPCILAGVLPSDIFVAIVDPRVRVS